jgi:hypothetical protein
MEVITYLVFFNKNFEFGKLGVWTFIVQLSYFKNGYRKL